MHANRTTFSGWMAEFREVKRAEELALMRKAINITCDAQNGADDASWNRK